MAGQDRMTIAEVVRQVLREEHADVIRESVRAVAQELMEAEVSELIGAERGERTEDRATHRNGYRPRRWDTRAGEIELQIPKIRQGSYFPSFLQPRKRSEQALVAVVQQAYVCGVSTRRVDQLVSRLGCGSQRARCRGSPGCSTSRFRRSGNARWRAATRMCSSTRRSRRSGRVQRKAVVVAHAVHETGRREIIGLDIGEAETEAFWTEFLRSLVARGLVGVQLAISDAHPGLKAALAKVLGAPWQRCTVHFLRDLRGHARKDQHDALGALSGRSSPRRTGQRPARGWPMPSPSSSRAYRRSPAARGGLGRLPGLHGAAGRALAELRSTIHWSASTARSAGAPTPSASSPTTPA